MSVRRALVDCVVLSLQDACVFYPCCKGCFSRVDVEPQDTTRCRCPKCGYSCPRDQIDHRYRLSLRVTRDTSIFGVTVFGTCLNPFFGIHASGLQRLVKNSEGPVEASTRSTLLAKAVEDCFIGRRFIFGLKVTGTERGPWLGGPGATGFSSKETNQFIASQMILPKAAGLGGCTVVSYYRVLLQKASEYELGSTDPSKSSRPRAKTLLLIPRHSPASSFNNATLSTSGLLSRSLQRSQYQDSTLTPTPPWQQSLGLITSSAEQEEGCSTQDSGDENSRQTDNNKSPHHAQRGCLENCNVTEDTVLSPPLSLECSSYNRPSFSKYPHSSIEKAVGNTPILNTWFSPSPPGHSSSKVISARKLTRTFLSSSLAWEDLPFSESLTEFLCEENKDFDIGCETEPHPNVQNQKGMTRNNPEISSQDKNLSIESISICQSNTQITDSHSQILLDISNTHAPNGGDLTDQVSKSPVGCINFFSHECNQKDEKASPLSFENEEEQLEGDTYNCSADLFSSSLTIDMNTNTQAETVRTTTETCPLLSKPDKQHLSSEKAEVPHSTPDQQKRRSNKCINRDSFPLSTQDLDFIPPSQSTPIVKVAAVSGPSASSFRNSTFCEFSLQPDSRDSSSAKTTSLCKLNRVRANQLPQCGKESTKENQGWSVRSSRNSHIFTPKRRFWKPDKRTNQPLAQQHQRVQRGALTTGSTERMGHKCDVTVCNYEDDEVIAVPPTPAAKARLSVKLGRRRQTDNSSSQFNFTLEGQQRNRVNCKRTLLDKTPTSSHRGLVQTGNCDSETVGESSLDGSNCYLLGEEEEACDWSRDLFSDSV